MKTNAEYWAVGQSAAIPTPFTHRMLSAHLLLDWVPALPPSAAASFIGWPPYLTTSVPIQKIKYMTLQDEAARSDRQWKGFLSWILGVAGTRHVLGLEGYRWIAPVSAFYPNAAHAVDLSKWHPAFPRSVLTIDRAPGNPSRLRPDYVALRGRSKGVPRGWALAESKGTAACLTSMVACPSDWHDQARNGEVNVSGKVRKVPRHLVVATRANPNALRLATRHVQVRAWNSNRGDRDLADAGAEADVISAHLFGLCRNLRLWENARALALAVAARRQSGESEEPGTSDKAAAEVNRRADQELQQLGQAHPDGADDWSEARFVRQTDPGTVEVDVHRSTINLLRYLRAAHVVDGRLDNAIQAADDNLEQWWTTAVVHEATDEAGVVHLRDGVRITVNHQLQHPSAGQAE